MINVFTVPTPGGTGTQHRLFNSQCQSRWGLARYGGTGTQYRLSDCVYRASTARDWHVKRCVNKSRTLDWPAPQALFLLGLARQTSDFSILSASPARDWHVMARQACPTDIRLIPVNRSICFTVRPRCFKSLSASFLDCKSKD